MEGSSALQVCRGMQGYAGVIPPFDKILFSGVWKDVREREWGWGGVREVWEREWDWG